MQFKIILLALFSLPIWASEPSSTANTPRFRMPDQRTMLELLENNRRCPNHIKKSGDNKYIATILANLVVSREELTYILYGYTPDVDNCDPEIEGFADFLIQWNKPC